MVCAKRFDLVDNLSVCGALTKGQDTVSNKGRVLMPDCLPVVVYLDSLI